MDLKFPMLTPDQIEVKVKQVFDWGAVMLLYKTARTDMDMLDKVVGPMNWTTDYKEIKGNLYCGIGIRDESGEFVWKWDWGTESRPDDEGNQKKGEASDAFKRAGFKVGIGRELYTGPRIMAHIPTEEYRGKMVLKEKHHKFNGFTVGDIAYEDGKIVRLRIDDSEGVAVFTYPRAGRATAPQRPPETAAPPARPTSPARATAAQDAATAALERARANPLNIDPNKPAPGQVKYMTEHFGPNELKQYRERYGENFEGMTRDEAAKMVAYLQKRASKSGAAS